MSTFHINPETGNPNVCRAKVKCPYGGPSDHYASKEEARTAFEEQVEKSKISSLRGVKLSRGAKLLFALDRAQQKVEAALKASQDENGKYKTDKVAFNNAIDVRDVIRKKLRDELKWDDTDAPAYDDAKTFDFKLVEYTDGQARQGYNNSNFQYGAREAKIYEVLDAASAEWMQRLSSAEIKALVIYNVDAQEYAKASAGQAHSLDPNVVKYFHSALEKAPKANDPFTIYAGISRERVIELREQALEGNIELKRVQSASANPAQVNGFMFPPDWEKEDTMALEFKTKTIASLSAFNIHKGEMELLAPPGNYKVVAHYENVDYNWDIPGSGRTSADTFVVEQVD